MNMYLVVCFFFLFGFILTDGACTFDTQYIGTWESTNYGTYTITSDYLFMVDKSFITGVTGTNFTCLLNEGSTYVIKSVASFTPFSTTTMFAYICIEFATLSEGNSYYYYQNSPEETGFGGERVKGIVTTTVVTTMDAVCDATLTASKTNEYHTMIKTGSESSGIVQCPNELLGVFQYSLTDVTGTKCNFVSSADVCNNNLTKMVFSYTLCPDRVAYSSGGEVGCLTSVTYNDVLYTTFYNFDSNVDGTTTYQFTCFAITTNTTSGEVLVSQKNTECDVGQSPTTMPPGGALLVLRPNITCVPVTPEEEESISTLPIILGCVFGFLILVLIIFLVIFLCWRYKMKQAEIMARRNKILVTDAHPMGETSLVIDAPRALEPMPESVLIERKPDTFKSKKKKKKSKEKPDGKLKNPMAESSMKLDFTQTTWTHPISRQAPTPMPNGHVPYDETEYWAMASVENTETTTIGSTVLRRSTTDFAKTPRGSIANGDVIRPMANGDITSRRMANGDVRRMSVTHSIHGGSVTPRSRIGARTPASITRADSRVSLKRQPSMKSLAKSKTTLATIEPEPFDPKPAEGRKPLADDEAKSNAMNEFMAAEMKWTNEADVVTSEFDGTKISSPTKKKTAKKKLKRKKKISVKTKRSKTTLSPQRSSPQRTSPQRSHYHSHNREFLKEPEAAVFKPKQPPQLPYRRSTTLSYSPDGRFLNSVLREYSSSVPPADTTKPGELYPPSSHKEPEHALKPVSSRKAWR